MQIKWKTLVNKGKALEEREHFEDAQLPTKMLYCFIQWMPMLIRL